MLRASMIAPISIKMKSTRITSSQASGERDGRRASAQWDAVGSGGSPGVSRGRIELWLTETLEVLSSSPHGATVDQRLADSSGGPADQRRLSSMPPGGAMAIGGGGTAGCSAGGGSTALPQLWQTNEPSLRAAASVFAAPQ